MYLKRLLLLPLLLSLNAGAQLPDMQVDRWLDSFNIRYHVSHPVWEDSRADEHFQEVTWNNAKGCYTSELPALLRYDALAGKPLRAVHIRHYRISNDRAYYPYFSKPTAASIAKTLHSYEASLPLADDQWLQYDPQGYLLQRIRKRYQTDTAITSIDSDQYSYERRKDGQQTISRKSIRIVTNNNRFPERKNEAFYWGTCCGAIYEGPVKQTHIDRVTFLLNARRQLAGVSQYTASYVNGCRDNNCKLGDDTGALARTIVYDQRGRLQSFRDSSLMQQKALGTMRFYYSDKPYSSDGNYRPVLKVPLMQQYMAHLKKPVISDIRCAWLCCAADGSDSVQTREERTTVIYDELHHLRFRFGPDYEGKERYTAYRESADSLGSYKNATGLYDLLKNTDHAVYTPTPYRNTVTIKMGCVIRDHYEQPEGTVASGTPRVSERKIIGKVTDSLYAITYGETSLVTGYEDNSFWAPASFERYASNYFPPKTLVVIDRRGLVRYFYEDGNVYVMDYE